MSQGAYSHPVLQLWADLHGQGVCFTVGWHVEMRDCWNLRGSCVFVALVWVNKWSKAGSTALSSGCPIDSSECLWSQFCHLLVTLCVLVMLRRHLKPKGGFYWTARILGPGARSFQCRWAGGFGWGSCTWPSLGVCDVALNIVEKPDAFLIILTCSSSTLVPDERSIASQSPLTSHLLPMVSSISLWSS